MRSFLSFDFHPPPHLSVNNMPRSSTPPNSRDASNGSVLSKTTPLKHNINGSQAHSSYPQPKASERYLDMTHDACEKFVGPMPVVEFLSEFIPEASEKQPDNKFMFPHSSVSENEDIFVSFRTFKLEGLSMLNPVILDQRNRGVRSLSQTQVHQYNSPTRWAISS